MKKTGYVIEFGEHQKVFAEEAVLVDTLTCLKAIPVRPTSVNLVEADEAELTGIQILDNSSFGYLVYFEKNSNPAEHGSMFVLAAELENTFKKIKEDGFKPCGFKWDCPALHSLRWVEVEMYNVYHNGFAMPWRMDVLKSLCEKLLLIDVTQEGFINSIREKTDNFTIITEAACEQLIQIMGEILSKYGDEQEVTTND